MEKKGKICYYCFQPATTKDHVIPLSLGGKNSFSNKVDCCKLCNNTKSNNSEEEFVKFLNFVKSQGVEFWSISRRQRRLLKAQFLKLTGIAIGGNQQATVKKSKVQSMRYRGEIAPNVRELQRMANDLNKDLLEKVA